MKSTTTLACRAIVLALLCFSIGSTSLFAQMRVGLPTSNPDGSAALEISSGPYSTGNQYRGMAPPKVALSQTSQATPINKPTIGLLVYNTATQNDLTPGYYYWEGTKWLRFSTNSSNAGARIAGGGQYIPAYLFSEARALTTTPDNIIIVDPGREGLFRYDASAAQGTVDNDGTIIRTSSGAIYRRALAGGLLNASMFAPAGVQTSTTLQKAIDATPVGGILVLSGNFAISGTVNISNKIHIIGNGAILTLTNAPSWGAIGYCFFYASGIDGITIEGVTFDGNRANVPSHPANNTVTFFNSCPNTLIQNCTAQNVQGGGSNLNSAFSFVDQSSYGKALNNTIQNCTGGAIFMQGHHSIMSNNVARSCSDIALVVNAASCHDASITGNTVESCKGGGIGIENGCYGIAVTGNAVSDIESGYGIGCVAIGNNPPRSYDLTITGNSVSRNTGTGASNAIAMAHCDNYVVNSNIVSGFNTANPNNSGLLLTGSNFSATGNQVRGNCYGIIANGSTFTIKGGYIRSENQIGVFFNTNCSNVQVEGVRVEAGTCFQKAGTFSGQLINNITNPFGSSPKRYVMGNVGYATPLTIIDPFILYLNSTDGIREMGRTATTYTLTAGEVKYYDLDLAVGKPYVESVSWGKVSTDGVGVTASFYGWANGGQTARFVVTNSTASSKAINYLYWELFGQRTEAATY